MDEHYRSRGRHRCRYRCGYDIDVDADVDADMDVAVMDVDLEITCLASRDSEFLTCLKILQISLERC